MQKKIPMRQCVGCREMKAKKELVRVVRSPEGEISLDFRGKAPGRGDHHQRDEDRDHPGHRPGKAPRRQQRRGARTARRCGGGGLRLAPLGQRRGLLGRARRQAHAPLLPGAAGRGG